MDGESNALSHLAGVIGGVRAGKIFLMNGGGSLSVSSNDPGISHIRQSGRFQMIVARDGIIVAIYGRPRMKLLQKLGAGIPVTDEELWLYRPRYSTYNPSF